MSPERTIGVILFGSGLVCAGSGLLQTMLPMRSGLEGFSTSAIGLLGTAYFGGIVAGCILGPRLIAHIGHIRAHTGTVCILTALTLALPIYPEAWFWVALRFLSGVALAVVFMTIESWLNDLASNENRGRVLSLYVIVSNAGWILGQFGVNLAGLQDVLLILVPTLAVCLSAAVVSLTPTQEPTAVPAARLDLGGLFRLSTVATLGCFLIGAAEGAFWSLAPLFGQQSGLSTFETTLLMGAFVLGGTLSQWPLGRLSDRNDRRLVMLPAVMLAVLTGLALALMPDGGTLLALILALLHGALMLPIYPLCLAHVNDQTPAEQMVQVSGGLLLIYSSGAAAGPLVAAAWMEESGAPALFYLISILLALFSLVILYRLAAARLVRRYDGQFSLAPRTTQAAYEIEAEDSDEPPSGAAITASR
ncbi:MAG: MFS transporter [Pseudomonadota bacterium]